MATLLFPPVGAQSPTSLIIRPDSPLTPPSSNAGNPDYTSSNWLGIPDTISRPPSILDVEPPVGLSTSVSPRKLFVTDDPSNENPFIRTPTKGRRVRSNTYASSPGKDDLHPHLSPYAHGASTYASSVYGSPSPTALRKTARSPTKITAPFTSTSPLTSPIKSPVRCQQSPTKTKKTQQQIIPPPPYSRYNTFTYSVKHQQARLGGSSSSGTGPPPFPMFLAQQKPAPQTQPPALQEPAPRHLIAPFPPADFFATGSQIGSALPPPLDTSRYNKVAPPKGISHAYFDPSSPNGILDDKSNLFSLRPEQRVRPRSTRAPPADVSPVELEARTTPLPAPRSHLSRFPSVRVDLTELSNRISRIGDIRETAGFWIAMYFIFNLGLTLYNKGVLVRFPYPYTLTALHTLCGTIGTCWMWYTGYFAPARLTTKENMTLSLFSILYTLNIAISNVSLQLVTVPFHQVVRASAPIPTIIFTFLLFGNRGRGLLGVGKPKLLTLVPVMLGVMFATYGDYYFTTWGLVLTLFGTVLASLKTIIANLLQTTTTTTTAAFPGMPITLQSGDATPPKTPLHRHHPLPSSKRLKLDPLDILLRMSPLAFVQCIIYAYISGEMQSVQQLTGGHFTNRRLCALLINGCIAFGLNIVSFTANKKSGPLTMTVAANVKQVLTIVLAVVIFNIHITVINGLGIMLTLLGGMWYASIEYGEKQRSTRNAFALTGQPEQRKGILLA